jgi:hypothetical protein
METQKHISALQNNKCSSYNWSTEYSIVIRKKQQNQPTC